MSTVCDPHANFSYSTVLTAPSPATSGTSLTVQAGDGAKFPTGGAFNATVWPSGVQPTSTNAEIVRVTAIATDTFTITRAQENSSAVAIAVGYQIAATVTAKAATDLEASVALGAACQFRLTLTSGTPVTTGDVTAATTIYFTPYGGNAIDLANSAGLLARYTSAEMSIAVPATTSQMYDIFCFNSSGTATLELLAWTNDTTRATAVINTAVKGIYTKSGDPTRRYVGSFRTTGVSGQTEDSVSNRFLWNAYNQKRRPMSKADATASWTYVTSATIRQVRAQTSNQVAFVVGLAESPLVATYFDLAQTDNASLHAIRIGLGLDSTTAFTATQSGNTVVTTSALQNGTVAQLLAYPAVGYHFLAMLEQGDVAVTTTFYGTGTYPGVATLLASIEG